MGILDLIFPKKCAGCGRSGGYFCSKCIELSKLQFPQVCPVCERNSIDGVKHKYCKEPFTPEGLTSIWVYEGAPRKLIQKIKYKFVYDAAQDLVLPALKILQENHVLKNKEFVVVPVPLYWQRKNWRGFNQVEELARLLSAGMGWKVENLLVRTKKTESQVGKTEKERRENIEGVFGLSLSTSQRGAKDFNIILFDDVWTTGATMLEATRVLKKSGFKNVWCLTLAR